MSYSAELFSCLSDFTTVSTSANTTAVKETATEATSGNISLSSSNSSSSSTATAIKTAMATSKPAVVSYVGSTPLASDAVSTETIGTSQLLSRAVTETSLSMSQDATHSFTRSKTVGGLPTLLSIVAAKSAAGALTSKKDDSLPIAVAFIESVNAMFLGSDQNR